MEVDVQKLPPGDATLIKNIVSNMKSQGIFDQIRRDCLADLDTKPSYQNLHQRVEGYVSKVLSTETWHPDLNKNQLRDTIRRKINESGMLASGVDHVVEQVVSSKIYQMFLPRIEVVVRQYLGLEKPPDITHQPQQQKQQPPQQQKQQPPQQPKLQPPQQPKLQPPQQQKQQPPQQQKQQPPQQQKQQPPQQQKQQPPQQQKQQPPQQQKLQPPQQQPPLHSQQLQHPPLPLPPPPPPLLQKLDLNKEILKDSAQQEQKQPLLPGPQLQETDLSESQEKNEKIKASEEAGDSHSVSKKEDSIKSIESSDTLKIVETETTDNKDVIKKEEEVNVHSSEQKSDRKLEVKNDEPKEQEKVEQKHEETTSDTEHAEKLTPKQSKDVKEGKVKRERSISEGSTKEIKAGEEKETKDKTKQDTHRKVISDHAKSVSEKEKKDIKPTAQDKQKTIDKGKCIESGKSKVQDDPKHKRKDSSQSSSHRDPGNKAQSGHQKTSESHIKSKTESKSKSSEMSKSKHSSKTSYSSKYHKQDTHSKSSSQTSSHAATSKISDHKHKHDSDSAVTSKHHKSSDDVSKHEKSSEGKLKSSETDKTKLAKNESKSKHDSEKLKSSSSSESKSKHISSGSKLSKSTADSGSSKAKHTDSRPKSHSSDKKSSRASSEEKHSKSKSESSSKSSSERDSKHTKIKESDKKGQSEKKDSEKTKGSDKISSTRHETSKSESRIDAKRIRTDSQSSHELSQGSEKDKSSSHKSRQTHQSPDKSKKIDRKEQKDEKIHEPSRKSSSTRSKSEKAKDIKKGDTIQKSCDSGEGCIGKDKKSSGCKQKVELQTSEKQTKCSDKSECHKKNKSDSSSNSKASSRESHKSTEDSKNQECKSSDSPLLTDKSEESESVSSTDSHISDSSSKHCDKKHHSHCKQESSHCTSSSSGEKSSEDNMCSTGEDPNKAGTETADGSLPKESCVLNRTETCNKSSSQFNKDFTIDESSAKSISRQNSEPVEKVDTISKHSSDSNHSASSDSGNYEENTVQRHSDNGLDDETKSSGEIKNVEDEGGGVDDEDKKSISALSDITVSSVHTSDLSSFDDEISLSSSEDDADVLEKPSKRRMSLKEVKEMAQKFTKGKEMSEEEENKDIKEVVEARNEADSDNAPIKETEKNSTPEKKSFLDLEQSTKVDESSPEIKSEPKMSLRRQRKINPKYASDEFSSIFTKHKKTSSGEVLENQSQDGLDRRTISEDSKWGNPTKISHKKHTLDIDNKLKEESVTSDILSTNSGDESIGSFSSTESPLGRKKKRLKMSDSDFISKDSVNTISSSKTVHSHSEASTQERYKNSKTVDSVSEDKFTQQWNRRSSRESDTESNNAEVPSNSKRRTSKTSESESAHYTITLKLKKVPDHEDDSIDCIKPPKTPDPDNVSSSEEISNISERTETKYPAFEQGGPANKDQLETSMPKQEVKRKRGRPRTRPLNMDTRGPKETSPHLVDPSKDNLSLQLGDGSQLSSDGAKTEGQGKSRPESQHSSKRYDSSDLYKPRPVIHSSTRRSRSGAQSPNSESSRISLQDQEAYDLTQPPRRQTRRSISQTQPTEGSSRGRKRKGDNSSSQPVKRRALNERHVCS